MKTERELFEEKYKELTGCDDFSLSRKKNGDYKFDGAYFGWHMWQASAQREGYKLVASGNTGVAALNTNRKFIGIEMDEGYFNIAKDRLAKTQEEV